MASYFHRERAGVDFAGLGGFENVAAFAGNALHERGEVSAGMKQRLVWKLNTSTSRFVATGGKRGSGAESIQFEVFFTTEKIERAHEGRVQWVSSVRHRSA